MKPRHKRALIIVAALAVIAVAALLILNALNSNIALYVTPSEVLTQVSCRIYLKKVRVPLYKDVLTLMVSLSQVKCLQSMMRTICLLKRSML